MVVETALGFFVRGLSAVVVWLSLSGCGSGTTGVPSGSKPPTDAGDAATSVDARAGIAEAGSDTRSVDLVALGDAGPAPPDFCVPPCVWRAVVACSPPPFTLCHEAPAVGANTALCDASSGWFRTEVTMGSAGEGGTEVRMGYDGQTCFTVGFGGRGGFGGLRVITDGARQLAVYGSGGGVVHCLDDQKDYSLDPARPECAPWVGPTGLTMVEPAFLCESTVPGDCAISP